MADNDTSTSLVDFDPQQAGQDMQAAQQQDLHNNAMQNFGTKPDGQPTPEAGKPRPWSLGTWAASLPQNITTGLIDGAVNTADTVRSLHGWLEHQGEHLHNQVVAAVTGEPAQPDQRPQLDKEENVPADPHTMTYQEGRDLALKYRDVLAVQDPNWQDKLTQGVGQFVVPMMGWTRGLGALEGVAKFTMNKVLKTAAADALTAATVIPPHESRMADLLALGKHVEGKYVDALNTLSPDGSALNGYINYMTNRGDESEAEGRFKNVVDQLTIGAAMSPFMKAGGLILKHSFDGLAYAMDNGVASSGDLIKGKKFQTGTFNPTGVDTTKMWDGYTHEVVDSHTGESMGTYASRQNALRYRDHYDNQYGAYRYDVRSTPPAKPEEK